MHVIQHTEFLAAMNEITVWWFCETENGENGKYTAGWIRDINKATKYPTCSAAKKTMQLRNCYMYEGSQVIKIVR